MNHIEQFDQYNEGLISNIKNKFSDFKISRICRDYFIRNYTIKNGVVSVDGSINLMMTNLDHLPLNFGVVTGSFDISDNKLVNLKGSPKEVGNFICEDNKIESLEGGPEIVNGGYYVTNNRNLTSLKGSPKEVIQFDCRNCDLDSLEGGPDKLDIFSCGFNRLLTSMEGGPSSVRVLKINSTDIWNFDHFPKHVVELYCDTTPLYEVWRLFEDTSKISMFQDYDIIREEDGERIIILDRLNSFLEDIGKSKWVIRDDHYYHIASRSLPSDKLRYFYKIV